MPHNRVRFVSVYKTFDHNLSKNEGRINAFQRSHEPRTIAVLLQSEVGELSTLSGVVKLGVGSPLRTLQMGYGCSRATAGR